MVKIQKTWEEVFVKATSKDGKVNTVIEISLNHQEKTFFLSSPQESELVSIRGTNSDKSLIEADLKLEAIKAAINYVKQNLK